MNSSEINLEEGWDEVEQGCMKLARIINEGMRESFPIAESSQHYTTIFKLCTGQKQLEEEIYNRYKDLWARYFDGVVVPALQGLSSQEMLLALHARYRAHMKMTKYWSGIFFKYLDKYYTPKKNCPSTKLVAYETFKDKVFTKMDSGIQRSVLDLIHRDREGEPVDTDLIKTIVQIFCDVGMRQVQTTRTRAQIGPQSDNKPREEVTLDVYENEFENDFLRDTTTYYQSKSQKWTEEDSFPDYMRKAEDLYNKEKHRCATYLHPTTEPKLLKTIDKELIGEHQIKLLNNPGSGLNVLLQRFVDCNGQDDEDLCRMYALFVRLPDGESSGITPISNMTREFITQVGMNVVEESKGKECDKLVERHVEKYHLFKKLVDGAFDADHRFQLAMKEAFEQIVNKDLEVKPATSSKAAKMVQTAELMADYIDHVLKGKMKLSGEETWVCMDNVVALFAHLQEKDVFRTFHSELLAKRLLLLHDKVNMDWEGGFISKLKTLAGAYFTGKMEKMIVDLTLMADAEERFNDECGGKVEYGGRDIKIDVQVLTRSNWPTYSVTEMTCPPEIQASMDHYRTFYDRCHDKRVLSWIHTLGTAQVELDFVPGKTQPTVTVSVVQAAMLLQFGSPEAELTCGELQQRLGLDAKFLKKYISSMAVLNKKHPEYQLLNITQPGGPSDDFSPEDKLSFNADGLGKLSSKKKLKKRFNMPLLEMKVDGAEQQEILKKLMQERVMNIDAQIVRIMKNRERMTRGLLVMQVVNDLKHLFPVQASFVTGRIQVLAEGAYDEGQLLKPVGDDEYEYVA